MGLIKSIRDNLDRKKSMKAYNKIITALKTGNETTIIYLSTEKGYETLFRKLDEDGYKWKIAGNYREGIFLTVERSK